MKKQKQINKTINPRTFLMIKYLLNSKTIPKTIDPKTLPMIKYCLNSKTIPNIKTKKMKDKAIQLSKKLVLLKVSLGFQPKLLNQLKRMKQKK